MKNYSVIAAIALVGCVSTPEFEVNESEQARRDMAECRLEGEKKRTHGGLGGIAGALRYEESYNQVYSACMQARGYRLLNAD